MNRPYITVETILDRIRSAADEHSNLPTPDDSLQWLAGFLAREHATMNVGDWDNLVHIGLLLWRARATQEARDGAPRMR